MHVATLPRPRLSQSLWPLEVARHAPGQPIAITWTTYEPGPFDTATGLSLYRYPDPSLLMPAHNTKSSHHGDDDGLFSIPISALPPNYPGGSIVCSSPADRVYVLALTSPPDNRLTTPVCRALLDALDVLEFGPYAPGVVLTTSGIPRFYSNGLDLEHAFATSGFWATLYSLFRRFLTLVFTLPSLPPTRRGGGKLGSLLTTLF